VVWIELAVDVELSAELLALVPDEVAELSGYGYANDEEGWVCDAEGDDETDVANADSVVAALVLDKLSADEGELAEAVALVYGDKVVGSVAESVLVA